MGSTRVLLATLPCVLLGWLCAPAAVAVRPWPKESLPAFERQLNSRQVKAVSLRAGSRRFRVLLKDGTRRVVVFPAGAKKRLVSDAKAAGVVVRLPKPPPVSHRRRYIAAAVVIVVILLAVAGWLLLRRRRRMREEQGPRLAAPA